MQKNVDIITARPSKSFFIDMITRDLTVGDCLLDLVDNAIDHAVKMSNIDVMEILMDGAELSKFPGASVFLKISADEVLIKDTCGGISIHEAKNHIFLFGNPTEGEPPRGESVGLSVYGIGMKRAFFKLGNKITVTSITAEESWRVDIDVNEFKDRGDSDWTFKFSEQSVLAKEATAVTTGTTIRVTELWEGIKNRISQQSFVNELREKMAATYSLFIEAGINIDINDAPVHWTLPKLGKEPRITPARKIIKKGDVDILIIAGVTAKEDQMPRGWYVFCNGRMILEADKTELTGWGSLMAKWHVKFNHFVGYAYFRSKNLGELPWTTTKRGIVLESPIYLAAMAEMQVQSRPVLTFLTSLYPGDMEPEGLLEREVLDEAKSVPINTLPRRESVFSVNLSNQRAARENDEVSIQYTKRKRDIDRIKSCSSVLKRASARKIGSYTFDYYLKQECQ